jgi:thymidylate synthase
MRFLTTNRFEKEYKKKMKQGKDVNKLDAVMDKLNETPRRRDSGVSKISPPLRGGD